MFKKNGIGVLFDNSAKCIVCKSEIACKNGNTSTMLRHAKKHRIEWEAIEKAAEKEQKQPTIPSLLMPPKSAGIQKYKHNSDRKKKLDEILVRLVAKDMRPLSVVRNTGFRDYSAAMDEKYTLPSTKTLRQKLIPRIYHRSMIELIQQLEPIKHVSLTTDGWTSSSADKYNVYTLHYIDWSKATPFIEFKILECSPYDMVSSKVELEKDLRRVTTKFGINEKICLNVADNAENIQGALKLFGAPKIGCSAHKLNLCAKRVTDKVEKVKDLKSKVADIVRTTKVSANAKKILFECQRTVGFQKPRTLVSSVSTRWNTVYLMFQTLLGK